MYNAFVLIGLALCVCGQVSQTFTEAENEESKSKCYVNHVGEMEMRTVRILEDGTFSQGRNDDLLDTVPLVHDTNVPERNSHPILLRS